MKNSHQLLSGKLTSVTGASRGLGREIALALGLAGADVVTTGFLIKNEVVDKEKLARH
jgi:NAD(P)-dependent dehydrogenase (short-subunit alcohol dehydrogenase family)